MSREAILQVLAAEEEAKKIVDSANERAALMIKEAKTRAEHEYMEYTEYLHAEYGRRVELVGEDAELLISERRADAERDAEIMCREAVQNIPLAVREVVRRMVNECQ